MQKTIYWLIGAIAVVAVVIVIILAMRGYRQQPTIQPLPISEETTQTPEATTGAAEGQIQLVLVSDNGFSPASITVAKGSKVRFLNQGTQTHNIASNPHPVHSDLPGFESGNFEANESFEFRFSKVGTWGYHDHLNPALRATVVVTE